MNENRLEQQLAWYVNGTLDDQERAEVDAWLAEHPEARAQLAELEFLQETVAEVKADEPQLDPQGFDRLMSQIDELEALEVVEASTVEAEPAAKEAIPEPELKPTLPTLGLLERVQQWFNETFQWDMTPAFARVAVVAQFALVAVLGTALFIPQEEAGYEVLSGESAAPAVTEGVLVEIGIKPDASYAQLQALLKATGARFVGGPNSLGMFRVALPEGTDLETLSSHEIVIYLQQVQP